MCFLEYSIVLRDQMLYNGERNGSETVLVV